MSDTPGLAIETTGLSRRFGKHSGGRWPGTWRSAAPSTASSAERAGKSTTILHADRPAGLRRFSAYATPNSPAIPSPPKHAWVTCRTARPLTRGCGSGRCWHSAKASSLLESDALASHLQKIPDRPALTDSKPQRELGPSCRSVSRSPTIPKILILTNRPTAWDPIARRRILLKRCSVLRSIHPAPS